MKLLHLALIDIAPGQAGNGGTQQTYEWTNIDVVTMPTTLQGGPMFLDDGRRVIAAADGSVLYRVAWSNTEIGPGRRHEMQIVLRDPKGNEVWSAGGEFIVTTESSDPSGLTSQEGTIPFMSPGGDPKVP